MMSSAIAAKLIYSRRFSALAESPAQACAGSRDDPAAMRCDVTLTLTHGPKDKSKSKDMDVDMDIPACHVFYSTGKCTIRRGYDTEEIGLKCIGICLRCGRSPTDATVLQTHSSPEKESSNPIHSCQANPSWRRDAVVDSFPFFLPRSPAPLNHPSSPTARCPLEKRKASLCERHTYVLGKAAGSLAER
jgi:hypothetical protein